jgi:hypothetical protein
MKTRTATALLVALAASNLVLTSAARAADEPSVVPIGHADFVPTPEHPIGARGDGMGNYEGATPPIEWWDGTPVQRDVLMQPQGAQWDVPADKPTKAWDQADTKSKNILWKVPAPGWGYAHPIVVGNPSTSLRAGNPSTSSTNSGQAGSRLRDDATARQAGRGRLYTVGHPYWVACYDADTGKELWKKAMTPMLAAGMEAEKAEKLRKVLDLALALFIRSRGDDYGGSPFLFGPLTKREVENPEPSLKSRVDACDKALAMIAKYRGDVEAIGDPKLIAALDHDAAQVEDQIKEIKTAENPQAAIRDVCKKKDRTFGALRNALAEGYDIPFPWGWYGYIGWADASLASDGERIYGTLAQGQMFCYDLDGKLLWSRQDGGRSCDNGYNFNRPPLVADGVVCVRLQVPDKTSKLSRWVGFDSKTGNLLWEVPFGLHGFVAPLTITLVDPSGKPVKVFVTHSPGKAADGSEHGSAFIRAKDGKVLGYCPGYKAGRGSHLTWHDGVLVCSAGADGRAPDPVAFRVKMTGPDAVSTELVAVGGKDYACVPNGEEFAVGFGPYRFQSNTLADMRTFQQMSTIPWVRETATKVGPYLIGRTGGPGLAGAMTYRTKRADKRALDCFQVIDLSDVRNPRLLSNRNVLSFTEPPTDHIITTYLPDRDPLVFSGVYQGSASYFGTDMSGVVGHGDRIYLQSAAFLYCIGPAVKGTPKDDPTMVATIRAAKNVDEVAKYLDSDSAQYRYEAVKRVAALGKGQEVSGKLETLAKTDTYEEIRSEAFRALGLEVGKTGAKALAEHIAALDIGNPHSPNAVGIGDVVMTLRTLGKEAESTLVALLSDADLKQRTRAAMLVQVLGPGGEAVRDALIAFMADDKAAQAVVQPARALSAWPVDAKVTETFVGLINTAQQGLKQGPAFEYLYRSMTEEKKNAFLSEVAAKNPDQSTWTRAVEELVERKAFDVLGPVIQASTGRRQGGLFWPLCHAAKTPEVKKFAVEQMRLKLEAKANPEDLNINALPALGADAAPLLPLLKAITPENATVKNAIADIERKVAEAEKK